MGTETCFWRGFRHEQLFAVALDKENATEVERFAMGARIRSVAQGPEGSLWVLENDSRGSQGRLLKLAPIGIALALKRFLS